MSKNHEQASKLTLKEAREQGKLEQFIKEHENDPPGDTDKLTKTLQDITKKAKDSKTKANEKKSD